jgi:hypothetical protein
MTPNSIKQYLNTTINEFFGSVEELESIVSTKDLDYIYNFPNEVLIITIWDFTLDLISLGKRDRAEYYILDKNLNLITTVYNSNNINGDDTVFDYALTIPHASYFHISFREYDSLKTVLVWLVKELPIKQKEYYVKETLTKKNVYQPVVRRTGDINLLNPYTGWLNVYYLAGDINERLTPWNIVGNPKSILVASSEKSQIHFNVALNGWYAFLLLPNTEGIEILTLKSITGVGIDKLNLINGLAYISITDSMREESSPIDPLYRNVFSIEATLDYALTKVSYSLDVVLDEVIVEISPKVESN